LDNFIGKRRVVKRERMGAFVEGRLDVNIQVGEVVIVLRL
jgi:hypothetical protein